METSIETSRDLSLLETIQYDPDVTQATLATQLGVAVGTVNWHIQRLVAKGYVKVTQAERRKLRYIVTPDGLALSARLTIDYVEQQFNLYRRVRQKVKEYLEKAKRDGFEHVRLLGDGDVADICRLTCLEQGVAIVDEPNVPALVVNGLKVILDMEVA